MVVATMKSNQRDLVEDLRLLYPRFGFIDRAFWIRRCAPFFEGHIENTIRVLEGADYMVRLRD